VRSRIRHQLGLGLGLPSRVTLGLGRDTQEKSPRFPGGRSRLVTVA
jgi:hypothetical protein